MPSEILHSIHVYREISEICRCKHPKITKNVFLEVGWGGGGGVVGGTENQCHLTCMSTHIM